jgi:pilus assembly protein FimV
MSNGKNPLMMMMALAMPGAASALGLGEIHVDSGLNERFAAEIDIVGATADDLIDLRAAVANRETFLRYGADRPAFLASATFKVATDSQGHPVLAVRSTDAFTEPLVNFLVDLRWHKSEIVREYTLLLDPPGFGPATRVAQADNASGSAALPVAPSAPDVPGTPVAARPQTIPLAESKQQTTARRIDPPGREPIPAIAHLQQSGTGQTTQLKVGARATLRGIAWRVGARSESDLKRMMIAIFRANPNAFDGNINRLYLGATLSIPSDAAVAAISNTEAKREFHAQMAAWRGPVKKFAATDAVPTAPFANAPVPVPATGSPAAAVSHGAGSPAVAAAIAATAAAAPTVTASPAVADRDAAAAAEPDPDPNDAEALNQKIQSLEKQLSEVKGQIDSDQDKIVVLREQAERAADPAPIAAATQPGPKLQQASLVPIVAGFGVLAALAGLYWRIRRRARISTTAPQLDIPSYRDVVIPVRTNEASVNDATGMTVEHTVYEEPAAEQAAASESTMTQTQSDAQAQPTAAQASSADTQALPSVSEASADETQALPVPEPVDATQPLLPIMPPAAAAKRVNRAAATISRPDTGETTVNLRMDGTRVDGTRIESTRVEPARLDYNLLDLDMTAAQHVQMPSELHEHVVVKERRRNIADVLKLAIEREPDRHDLRMKLLEFYYSAAATNRQGFLEVVQKFARDRELLEPEVWEKICFMGRQIAAENPLFAETPAADDLADCA